MEPRTFHLGLIGYPLGHSRSPALHQAALAASGFTGEYRLFAIPPTPAGTAEIGQLIGDLRQGLLHGLNVTIPHKQTVIPFLDRLSPVAQAVGAANLLYIDSGGRAAGDNTDVPGFMRDVCQLCGTQTGCALVLGAGGSARAVVYGLAAAGWQVTVLARRVEQSAGLVAAIGAASGLSARMRSAELTPSALQAAACDLLVNTTPLGMHPNVSGCPWPEDLALPAQATVYDLVYNPLETVLVRRARAAGLPAANGAGMLVAQAALAFQCWTGVEAPFAIMQQAFH